MKTLGRYQSVISHFMLWLLLMVIPFGYFIATGCSLMESLRWMVPFLPMYGMWMSGFYISYFLFIPRFYLARRYLLFFASTTITYILLTRFTEFITQLMYHIDQPIPLKAEWIWLGTMGQAVFNILLLMTAIAFRVQQQNSLLSQQQEQPAGDKPTENPVTTPAEPVAQQPLATLSYIFVKCEYKQVRVDLDDIMYISSMKDYVRIRLMSQPTLITALSTLKAIEEKLPQDRFCRIHRSHIVALNKIKSVENNRIKIADQLLPISETYQDKFYEMVSRS